MPIPYKQTVNTIIQKVRRIRIEKQYSQQFVASRLDISRKAYSRIESGTSRISLVKFIKLAEILETDLYDLLNSNAGLLRIIA